MPRVLLVPASNAAVRRFHERMIRQGLPLERVLPFVKPPVSDALRTRFPDAAVRIWGSTTGIRNTPIWEQMRSGDIALFYQQGKINSSPLVTFKLRNPELARDLWGLDPEKKEPWELLYFLEDFREEAIPYSTLWDVARQGPQHFLRGLTLLSPERSREVIQKFGLGREDRALQEEEMILSAMEAVYPSKSGQEFRSSVAVRAAIKAYAIRRAEVYFRTLGFEVEDIHERAAFDLRCTRGDQMLVVLAKGTQSDDREVLLTPSEVSLARSNPAQTALFILHSIDLSEAGGQVSVEGGKEEVIRPWDIDSGQLMPLGFFYRLPESSST